MRFPFVVYLFVCVIAVIATPWLAQSPNGNINGLISDPSSAAVVGAVLQKLPKDDAKSTSHLIYASTKLGSSRDRASLESSPRIARSGQPACEVDEGFADIEPTLNT